MFGLFGFKPTTHHNGYSALISYWLGLEVYKGVLASTNATNGREITYPQLMAIGKLKRLMNKQKSTPVSKVNRDVERFQLKDGNKYHRTIYGLCGTPVQVDAYRVSDAFPTGSSPIDHAVKKMLCAGLRGHKDKLTDIDNAIESLQAARLLLIQKGEV